MNNEPKYPKTDASLKAKGGPKDNAAYNGSNVAAGARKGAPLDKQGAVAKKDEPIYKEACKDE